ncbi:MAG: hypothetical protein GF350_09295 [Chitinivibrionales bacterium]|nr:hypothetical protein [Chitinivibrionales bacterium]
MKEYHHALHKVSGKVDRFFKKAFDSVCLTRPSVDFATLKGSPIMITSSHRSQADYFLIGNILHRIGIDNLRFAAGDNLTNLPVIGKWFQKWGAFPVERHRSSNRSYILRLCNQVSSMLEQGDNVIVFPEMGRSYTGRMLEMKQVIIGAAVLAQERNPEIRYLYLPSTVSYELLPELSYFETLLKGKKMRAPGNDMVRRGIGNVYYFGADAIAFLKFLLGHRFGRKYGNVYVDIGDPVAIDEIVDLAALRNAKASNEFWANRTAMKRISTEIYRRLLCLFRVLPVHIVASLLESHRACSLSSLKESVPLVLDSVRTEGRNVKSVGSLGAAELVEDGIRILHRMNAVRKRNNEIIVRNDPIVRYYAATIEKV